MHFSRIVGAYLMGILLGAGFVSCPAFAQEVGDLPTAAQELTARILACEETPGGAVVLLGCGDGRLAVALQASGYRLVHALDTDDDAIAAARGHIQHCGLYGSIAVDALKGGQLPYAEDQVNLLVVQDPLGLDQGEFLRVLCPGGKAVFVAPGGRELANRSLTKPWPTDTDEWTHFLHDPSGNAVAHDQRVGPPRRVQWVAEPGYTRSHEHIPSISSVVSTGGRVFYIADLASVGAIRDTPRWHLVARDAFNGIQLWKEPIPNWFPHIINWGQTPKELQRKLVAVGDRVYVTLGLHAPLSALDAATGEVVKTYPETHGTEEVLCHQGILLLAMRDVTDERIAELAKWSELVMQDDSPIFERTSAEPLVRRLRSIERQSQPVIAALDAATGELLWKKSDADSSGLKTLSLSALGSHVFYQTGQTLRCVELNSGKPVWSAEAPTVRTISEQGIFCAGGGQIVALSPETGERLWDQPLSVAEVRDVFVANDSLWIGGFKPFPEKRGPSWGPYFVTQRDLKDGRQRMHIAPDNPEHHHRCYQNKATDRYILGGRRGTEFIDLQSGDVQWNSFARGVCKYGVMPSNGLLYVPPHACACYVQAKLIGFHALAAADSEDRPRLDGAERIVRGAAFDPSPMPSPALSSTEEWLTYRHDCQRSGATSVALSARLARRWQAELGGTPTSPTIAGGRVFVAVTDRHSVSALEADSGEVCWTFTTGGRVDSPPTLCGDRALFGSRDGRVYSLRARDGELAWQLLPAQRERWVVVRGQFESASPIHGSVLVQGGDAYVMTGTSSYLDGGLGLDRVEPASGRIKSHQQWYSPDPVTDQQPEQTAPYAMPGGRADILSGDGNFLYLRDAVYDAAGQPLSHGNPHLLTLTGYLDGSWAHRSYWIFGTKCSISTGCSGRDKNIIAGRLLVFNDATIFGYGRSRVDWSNQLLDGPYRLFAVGRDDGTPRWTARLGIQVRAMVLAGDTLFVAGPDAEANVRGASAESKLLAIAAADGSQLAEYELESMPTFDGMAAARGHLFLALENGSLVCFEGR